MYGIGALLGSNFFQHRPKHLRCRRLASLWALQRLYRRHALIRIGQRQSFLQRVNHALLRCWLARSVSPVVPQILFVQNRRDQLLCLLLAICSRHRFRMFRLRKPHQIGRLDTPLGFPKAQHLLPIGCVISKLGGWHFLEGLGGWHFLRWLGGWHFLGGLGGWHFLWNLCSGSYIASLQPRHVPLVAPLHILPNFFRRLWNCSLDVVIHIGFVPRSNFCAIRRSRGALGVRGFEPLVEPELWAYIW